MRAWLVYALSALGLSLTITGCMPLTGGMQPALLGPRPVSYQASAGVMPLWPYVMFRDQTGALSVQPNTALDMHGRTAAREVTGSACQSGLQLPIGAWGGGKGGKSALALSGGWGEGGTENALQDASRDMGQNDAMFDIRVDLNTVAILGVWHQACVVVHARVALGALPELVAPSPSQSLQVQHL